MKVLLPILFALAVANPLQAADPVATLTKDDIFTGRGAVIGDLGVSLTEYITVEGVPIAPSKGRKRYPSFDEIAKNGVTMLEVYAVNGTPLSHPRIIHLSGENKFAPANIYTLRGYQTLLIAPVGLDPQETREFDLPQVTEPLRYRFVPTKVIKVETR